MHTTFAMVSNPTLLEMKKKMRKKKLQQNQSEDVRRGEKISESLTPKKNES